MAYETILYSVEDGVATLTLNRPEVQNGFNIPVCDEIMAAIEEAKQDASVKFLVIKKSFLLVVTLIKCKKRLL